MQIADREYKLRKIEYYFILNLSEIIHNFANLSKVFCVKPIVIFNL